MLINGFAISGYRSFGSELQKIGPLEKINLIIGQNNSGKSNVLRFLAEHYTTLVNVLAKRESRENLNFTDLDRHRGAKNDEFQFAIAVDFKEENLAELMKLLRDSTKINTIGQDLLSRILNSDAFTNGGNLSWFIFKTNSFAEEYKIQRELRSDIFSCKPIEADEWRVLSNLLATTSSGNINTNFDRVMESIIPLILKPPTIKLIPTFRRIKNRESNKSTEYDFSGEGIIDELVKLKDPDHNEQKNKERFNKINEFLRNVIGNKTASLEIPHHRQTITVLMDNKALPLESLGTGIHEVIMLAAATTILENAVVCIEEPELHLHPNLQRKLIQYLYNNTNNQYLITTHSAHLLDTSIASHFHVLHENGESIIRPVIKSYEKFMVCEDLGYRASDIIQSNCIIWVEGPSDRLYINHWIQSSSDYLTEGVHYSIMFYGGRLQSHLSSEHEIEDIENFISLRSINRKMCIVIDSDKDKSTTRINKTKKRLKDEFNEGPGFAWITKGREIENYIDADLLEIAVIETHKSIKKLDSKNIYSNTLKIKKPRSTKYFNINKVKIAHKVIEQAANLNILDLSENIDKLIIFINDSNKID